MKSCKNKRNGASLCVTIGVIVFLLLTTRAYAATITIPFTDLNAGIAPIYTNGDTVAVQGDGLDATGWATLRALSVPFGLELPDQTLSIPEDAMMNNVALTSFSAPKCTHIDDATSASNGAFYKCGKLQSLDLPSVTSVGKNAFYLCRELDNLNLPVATTIASRAFSSCYELENISMPAVTSIDNYAFFGDKKLETLTFPALVSIGDYTFQYCSEIASISMPAVNSIGKSTFDNCIGLENVNLPAVTSIDNNAFQNCKTLESISLPAATSIGMRAFQNCKALESIDIPAIMSIGNFAFQNCSELQDYTFGPIPPSSIGTTVGQSSLGTPDYYAAADVTLSPWSSFNLDMLNHMPTLSDISSNVYALTPLTDSVMMKGTSQSFSVTLTGSVRPTIYQNWVLWELQGTNVRSTVDANGKVTIDPDETNTVLILKASANIGGIITSQTAIITLFSATPTSTLAPTPTPIPTPTSIPTNSTVPTNSAVPTRTPNAIDKVTTTGNSDDNTSVIYPLSTTTLLPYIISMIETEDVEEGSQAEDVDDNSQDQIVPSTGSSFMPVAFMGIGLVCASVILIQKKRKFSKR